MSNTLLIGAGGLAKQCIQIIRSLDRLRYGKRFLYSNSIEPDYKFGLKTLNDDSLKDHHN